MKKLCMLILLTSIIFVIFLIKNSENNYIVENKPLSYFINGEETDTIPEKGNYDVTVTCDKGATATWDTDTWSLTIYNAAQTGTRCSVNFKTTFYIDSSGASSPELFAGLIPIRFENNTPIITDTSESWYNYADHEWANAILINQSNASIKNKYINSDGTYKSGTVVDMSDVLQMYVWIPRYRYKLFNVNGSNTNSQMIEVEFEDSTTSKSNGTQNGEWLTHPAFTFGTTELSGIWVGKFESSNSTSDVKIIPNVSSLRNINIASMFNASRAIESNSKYGLDANTIDTHMMKNMEWGAVSYLTYSKYGRYIDSNTCISSGCEVWKNNNTNYITGCGRSSSGESQTSSCNQWNTAVGINASTTGNIYGIYDMFGGADEYVMGNMTNSSGRFYPQSSGLSQPDSKYYDSYSYNSSSSNYSRGKLGDATIEVYNWPNVYKYFVSSTTPWFSRGCDYSFPNTSNMLGFYGDNGSAAAYSAFRVVLTQS